MKTEIEKYYNDFEELEAIILVE